MAEKDIAIHASHLGKKFARSLKHAMIYGLHDIARAAVQSPGLRSSGRYRTGDGIGAADTGTDGTQEALGDGCLRPTEFWALRDVNFRIKKGERVGVIGPNGAGKSTLFSVLSGIYGPSEGRVEVRGQLQALIALGAGFHPTLSGRENVYINAAILGLTTREVNTKIESIIEFADIGEFIDAPVRTYSSGMLVRLGFAIAAHLDPDIMLIDEVLAVGDAKFQSKCISFSRKLAEEGRTVVMVSHNLSQIQRVCSRVIWLDHGHIMMDGDADDVIRNYSVWAMQGMVGTAGGAAFPRKVASDVISFTYALQNASDLQHMGSSETAQHYGNLPVVKRGSTLEVRIDYELHRPIDGKLSFWLHVKEHLVAVRVFGAAGWQCGALIPAVEGQRGTVQITFPNIPLLEGLYSFDIGVSDFGAVGETASLADNLELQPSFVVVSPKGAPQRAVESIGKATRMPLIDIPVHMETKIKKAV